MSNPTELPDLDMPATTDAARDYLIAWHRENLTAAPYFTDYISKTLAGDFAYHLARWLARRAQPEGDRLLRLQTEVLKCPGLNIMNYDDEHVAALEHWATHTVRVAQTILAEADFRADAEPSAQPECEAPQDVPAGYLIEWNIGPHCKRSRFCFHKPSPEEVNELGSPTDVKVTEVFRVSTTEVAPFDARRFGIDMTDDEIEEIAVDFYTPGTSSIDTVFGFARAIETRCRAAQHAESGAPAAEVIEMLLGVAYRAFNALDGAEEIEGGHVVDNADFAALSEAMDRLDGLPDDQPGYTMEAAAKARWALRPILAAQSQGAQALDAVRGKLDAVWQSVCDAVAKYSGKPCEGEPFDRLDELLAAAKAEAPAHETIVQQADQLVCTACGTSVQQAAAPGALASSLNVTTKQPQIDYSVVSAYADKHRLHFNGLCAMVRQAAAPSAPGTPEAPKEPAHGHRDDYYLLANGRRLGLEPISRVRHMPNWVLAMELFATGSTSAHQLCRDAGVDPDSTTTQSAAQLDGGQGVGA